MSDANDRQRGDGQESLIEFPCRFPIKAMGLDESEFEAHVLQIISAHVDEGAPAQERRAVRGLSRLGVGGCAGTGTGDREGFGGRHRL